MLRAAPLPHLPPRLNIVGNWPGIHEHPVFESNEEIWVFNGRGATLPKYNAVFQMHLDCDWGGNWSRRWFLENRTIPVFVRELRDEIPAGIQYPFDKVFGMLENVTLLDEPLRYFTSTICWAIALSVLQKRPYVRVLGVEMKDDEYVRQKDGYAFWVGFAAGRGTRLEIDCTKELFDQPLYGSYPLEQKA